MSTDSYNYFGRDETYLDEKLLPFVKCGGYVYIAIPGMVRDCRDSLPSEMLLSWTPEQLDYMHDVSYWTDMVSKCRGAKVLTVEQMQSNEEVWADWLAQDNEYAVGDRRSMDAGAGKYLNFIKIVLQKKCFCFLGNCANNSFGHKHNDSIRLCRLCILLPRKKHGHTVRCPRVRNYAVILMLS